MTKPGDSQTKKTIHELAKEFPNKTYKELEKYRDADRQEEAIGIGHNQPPVEEGEEQDTPTLWEIAKAHNVSYADAVPIQEDMRLDKDAKAARAKLKKKTEGTCIMGEMRKDRTYPDLTEVLVQENVKLKKRAEEAEGELSIMKGIETNRVKEAQARSSQLQDELEKAKKENSDLYNRIAELIETNEKEIKNLKWIKDHDYIFLVDENKKLHAEIKKLKEGTVDRARKAGL